MSLMQWFMSHFSVDAGWSLLQPLLYYTIGIAIYSVFIFKFYRFIARKDIFNLDLNQYNTAGIAFFRKLIRIIYYIIEYILLFPIFAFFWFGILTALLAFLSKNQNLDNILLVSVAVVCAIRITSYYNEDLSKDLAKMLPFALLGVFLVDVSYFSFSDSITLLKTIPSIWEVLVYYMAFIFLLELVLRMISLFSVAASGDDDSRFVKMR